MFRPTGKHLDEIQLSEIANHFSPEEIDKVLSDYHYLVDETSNDKLFQFKQICCMVPNPFELSTEIYVLDLKHGPAEKWLEKGSEYTLVNLSRRLLKEYSELARKLIVEMDKQ